MYYRKWLNSQINLSDFSVYKGISIRELCRVSGTQMSTSIKNKN